MKLLKHSLNMKPYIKGILLAVCVLLVVAPDANAQLFGKKKKPGSGIGNALKNKLSNPLKKPDANKGPKLDVGKSLNQLAGARIAIISAQLRMLDALGLKTKAAVRLSESKRILEGASSDSGAQVKALNDSVKASEAAGEEIRDAMKESGQLTAEKKRAWAEARIMWGTGVILEFQQVKTIISLAEQLKGDLELGIPILQLSRLTKGDIKEFNNFRKVAKEFRKKQEIEVSTEGEDVLGEL